MDSMEITGLVEKILDLETFDSGFTKRVLVVNTGGDYPQLIPVEFVKDKTALLDSLSEGQQVTVSINLRGNEYNGKYYVNIQGWKLSGEAAVQTKIEEPQGTATGTDNNGEASDDLPF